MPPAPTMTRLSPRCSPAELCRAPYAVNTAQPNVALSAYGTPGSSAATEDAGVTQYSASPPMLCTGRVCTEEGV